MSKLLEGKVAAITGASTGIGRAIAVSYLQHGASVVVNHYPDDKSIAQFQALADEVGHNAPLIAVPGDISKPETGQELVAKTVQQYGKLDIFVSNAGVCEFADFLTFVLSSPYGPCRCLLSEGCLPISSTTPSQQI